MFLIIRKDKIIAFVIACCTVYILFLMTSVFTRIPNNTIETSANVKSTSTYPVQSQNKNEQELNIINNISK